MSSKTHLGENLQTSCTHCGSLFRIEIGQIEAARGQVRCSQCMQVFNALLNLENYQGGESSEPELSAVEDADLADYPSKEATGETIFSPDAQELSLREAMYGEHHASNHSFKAILWLLGILVLVIVAVVQLVYYQRYQLIARPYYQQQILNLCRILPCDTNRFVSAEQIRMLERNVFSHPTRNKALMVTGAFINDASFEQKLPGLLISLSDLKGNLIANRRFSAEEYLRDKSLVRVGAGQSVQFQLEIVDPGNEALTYEFEFVS
jgi:predicted Zn finger-like uncharacterized protein